jgi:hypothetical protein
VPENGQAATTWNEDITQLRRDRGLPEEDIESHRRWKFGARDRQWKCLRGEVTFMLQLAD